MIKLAPALMRSAGKKVVLEKHLKKLLSLLSAKYGTEIATEDITVFWHDGIPTTESVRAEIATEDITVFWHDGIPTTEFVRAEIAKKHLETGWSKKRVLMQDYGFDENTAETILEELRTETPAMPSFGIDEGDDQGGDETE